MDNNSSAESGRVYLENENAAGSTTGNKTPPLCIHPVRPASILHTETGLPDGFILHLLSELKLISAAEQLVSSLWTGFTFLFVWRENLIHWPQTDGWHIREQTWMNELSRWVDENDVNRALWPPESPDLISNRSLIMLNDEMKKMRPASLTFTVIIQASTAKYFLKPSVMKPEREQKALFFFLAIRTFQSLSLVLLKVHYRPHPGASPVMLILSEWGFSWLINSKICRINFLLIVLINQLIVSGLHNTVELYWSRSEGHCLAQEHSVSSWWWIWGLTLRF